MRNNSMAFPKFMPTDSHSSLYGGSILSTSWYEGDSAYLRLSMIQQSQSSLYTWNVSVKLL